MPELALQPSDCHPDLHFDRLVEIAQFLANVRSGTAALHAPHEGDDTWSLGCRGFARARNLLIQKQSKGDWPWFGIVDAGKRLIFRIGKVPVRFYRGSVARPPTRTLAESAEELSQMSLAFPDAGLDYAKLAWRFALETDVFGQPARIIFAGLTREGGETVVSWEIPFEHDLGTADLSPPKVDDIVEMAPPVVHAPDAVPQRRQQNE